MIIMDKVVRIGKSKGPYDRCKSDVFCKIRYNNFKKLSISGVIGPKSNGNASGSSGQINMDPLNIVEYAPGWDAHLEDCFLAIWKQYHLNDMQAGTPAQTQVVDRRKSEYPGYPKSHYEWALEVLREEGLEVDGGYKYGSKWLRIEVPDDVLEFLNNLPNTDKTPAWV